MNRHLFLLTILITAMVVLTSVGGLLLPDIYARETQNWQVQSIGQDMVDLFFVMPVLIFSAAFARRGNSIALTIWTGTVVYLIYTFIIYCFDVHFNSLFLVYCFGLGLSFYAAAYLIKGKFLKHQNGIQVYSPFAKGLGIYFITIASVFYALWLSEIIPAIAASQIPESLSEVALPTNAVHVLDLSIVLPGIFIAGINLVRKNPTGYLLAPVVLTFFLLMDVTIGFLTMMMNWRGIANGYGVSYAMAALALTSAWLLLRYYQKTVL